MSEPTIQRGEVPEKPMQGLDAVVKVIRFAGLGMFCFGLIIFLDFGDVAALLGLHDGMIHKMLGGMLMFMGAVEIFIMPHVLALVQKNKTPPKNLD